MRMRILNADLEFAISDLLMMVETVVSGYGGGNGDGQQVVGPALEAEHLESDQECSQRAVGDAAEEASHADGGREAGGNSHERADDGPESGADEERGNDLAALEACSYGDGGKQDLEQESVDRDGLALRVMGSLLKENNSAEGKNGEEKD